MKTALVSTPSESRPINWTVAARPTVFRVGEKVALAYFVFTAVLVSLHRRPVSRCLLAWAVPLILSTVLALESRYSSSWSRVTRDWAVLALILIAYWQVDWLGSGSTQATWQHTWIGWDRYLLHQAGLSRADRVTRRIVALSSGGRLSMSVRNSADLHGPSLYAASKR